MDNIGAFGEIPASMNNILIHEGGGRVLREPAAGLRGDLTLGRKLFGYQSTGNPKGQW